VKAKEMKPMMVETKERGLRVDLDITTPMIEM
jgi:hypothetical protein